MTESCLNKLDAEDGSRNWPQQQSSVCPKWRKGEGRWTTNVCGIPSQIITLISDSSALSQTATEASAHDTGLCVYSCLASQFMQQFQCVFLQTSIVYD